LAGCLWLSGGNHLSEDTRHGDRARIARVSAVRRYAS
jgi:hypothetical protein